ncbi:MAG: M1 family metallopeptidase [Bacteroidota bacterium]
MRIFTLILFVLFGLSSNAQLQRNNPGSNHANRFEELDYLLQSPNEYRTASGAPGPKYWQQRADYDIAVELDEPNNIIKGTETITYSNNSPDVLTYIWLQLDENFHKPDADVNRDNPSKILDRMTDQQLNALEPWRRLDGYGLNLTRVIDATGKAIKYTLVKTMMRIDLAEPLKPGQKFIFTIDWNYKVPDKLTRYGRGGYEHFADDDNNLYSIAQFYPRMAVYSDFKGWQHLQFRSGAEFALNFGNFNLKITVPADHVVAATGECVNYKQMMSAKEFDRWQNAQQAKDVVEIVTLAEALEKSKTKSTAKKTWIFKADNVRDVAFNTSRRLVWDAMPAYVDGKKVMCMSYYGKEAYPIYRRYSTKAVAHTIKTYSKYTISYPYPVAQSVEAAIGMEYPMLAMNPGRAAPDGTYTEAAKNSCIGVTIHEVGHNFFPMIVNSDERQWWWMDEGLNTFCQFLTEREFDADYPSSRGPAHLITDYMRLAKNELEPIMTKGDAVSKVGSNAYAKAATGLNILRETILGRELFDFGFQEYAKRWAFKHPTPADLFRTMEDATGVDLDWFWRGWYFGTDPVDISIDSVKVFKVDDALTPTLTGVSVYNDINRLRNKDDKSIKFYVDVDTTLRDFYYYNRNADAWYNQEQADKLKDDTYKAGIDNENLGKWKDKYFYELQFGNRGGLVMPIILEWTFKDGTKQVDKIPVTIWLLNEEKVTKVFIKDKEVASVKLDPNRETADINEANGQWPVKEMPTKFSLFKNTQVGFVGPGARQTVAPATNPMQRAKQRNP